MKKPPGTHIATSDTTSITVRGRDLVGDLIGQRTFTEMLYFLVGHRFPTEGQTRVLDACLVTLMEHGWTPTSIVARMIDLQGYYQQPVLADPYPNGASGYNSIHVNVTS